VEAVWIHHLVPRGQPFDFARKAFDGFGTSLKSYIKKFGGYDTSNIIANANAKVKME